VVKLSEAQTEPVTVGFAFTGGTAEPNGVPDKHTYTIVDPRLSVGFDATGGIKQESESPVVVGVSLSAPSQKNITVDYNVTGGTASAGADYKIESGTLIFSPGFTTNTIHIDLVEDGIDEGPENIVLTLSNPINAKPGNLQYTCTIVDPWAKLSFEMFKVDLGCPNSPETFKSRWVPWEIPNGCDGKPHDPCGISNIAGVNIDAYITPEPDNGSGNLQAGPGEALCNSFYSSLTANTENAGLELRLSGSGLVAGEYWLHSYHNADNRAVIPEITAAGGGVIQIEQVTDVPIQRVDSDDQLVPSVIKFYTDGAAPVVITYRSPPGHNAVVNAFALHNTVRPPYATHPTPADNAKNVPPDVSLAWVAGTGAAGHKVYLGTDPATVSKDIPGSAEYQTTVANCVYKPALLKFERTYYWRVDQISHSAKAPIKGKLWCLTTGSGKACKPIPIDGGNAIADTTLNWSPGAYANRHDVYFGSGFDAVQNANWTSVEYKGAGSKTYYEPAPLEEDTTYYWRVDQIGDGTYVKGDVWSFRTTSPLQLRVDFALPQWGKAEVVAGSAKPGWWHWAAGQWADMDMHAGVWEDGSSTKPTGSGIDGTGVHALITTGSKDQLGLHVKGMCRNNVAGGAPTGTAVGEPIANSWLYAVDRAGEFAGDLRLLLTELPAGRYELVSYHNHWEPCSEGTRNCMECVCEMPPMHSITANALPARAMQGYGRHWGLPPGTGAGVRAIENAYDVSVTNVTEDDRVSKSRIVFETDGSEVLVIYKAATSAYRDCGRPDQQGSRGILNAFELNFAAPIESHKASASSP
jgi:hypothetical protein